MRENLLGDAVSINLLGNQCVIFGADGRQKIGCLPFHVRTLNPVDLASDSGYRFRLKIRGKGFRHSFITHRPDTVSPAHRPYKS